MEFQTLAPEGTPTVSVSDAAASEDYSSIRFNVSLSHPSREPVTVWYETSDGTATSGTDFEATSYRLTLLANSWNRGYTADVPLVDDQEPEPDETFTLTLTRATGATLGDATATGTIVDDGDTAATITASDIEDTTATLTIAGHTDGWWYKGNAHSCTAVAAGTTAVGIDSLTAVTDYEYSAYSDSTCSTRLASVAFRTLAAEGVTPTVSVSDAEVSEDGAWMQFWVSLSQPSRKEVTVAFQTSGGTATSGTDFRAVSEVLTIPANSREPELVPVLVYDDRDPELDETFTATLTNPTGATLGDATATGMIIDDGDTAATGVAVVSEPGDDDTYAAGDAIRVRVTFGETVTVDTAQGAPRLKLDLGGAEGSGERWASYASGSGEAALTFAYAVAAGDDLDRGRRGARGHAGAQWRDDHVGCGRRSGAGPRGPGRGPGAQGGHGGARVLLGGGVGNVADGDLRRGAGRGLGAGGERLHGNGSTGARRRAQHRRHGPGGHRGRGGDGDAGRSGRARGDADGGLGAARREPGPRPRGQRSGGLLRRGGDERDGRAGAGGRGGGGSLGPGRGRHLRSR